MYSIEHNLLSSVQWKIGKAKINLLYLLKIRKVKKQLLGRIE